MQTRPLTTSLLFVLLCLLALPSFSIAAPKQLSPGHVPEIVKQKKAASLGRVPATNELRLALSLPLRDAAGLTNLLREIYNPASPQFHHYLTPAEFASRFGAAPADYATVLNFAKTNGLKITATHPNRLLVDVTGKASEVERAFHLRLNSFRHPRESRNFFAPDAEPSVDAAVPLFQVSGLDNFSPPHPNAQLRPAAFNNNASPRGGSGPVLDDGNTNNSYMGNDFRKAYAPGITLAGAGQSVALLQFDGFYPEDITNYAIAIGLTNVPSVIVKPVAGGVPNPGSGLFFGVDEVSLDIEMVLAMAPGISNIYVYEAPNPSPWVDMLSAIANDNLAKQIGCSWGGGGPDAAAEIIFLQMAAQGQSFYNASGDSAAFVGAVPFPSESPNITQVGGTTLVTDDSGNYTSETTWNWGYVPFPNPFVNHYFGSSGGISTRVALPAWQLGLDMATNHGSTALRNIPDVALVADNVFVIYNNGSSNRVGGTSVAAPLWAAFTALINEQAATLAQPPVGFLNPALYALARGTNYAGTFHDITTGNNTNAINPDDFYAGPGFDLCTGLGTPLGTNLINALTTPDNLLILEAGIFTANGFVGGPFTQTNWSVTLTNVGGASLTWSLGGVPAWLAVSVNGGTLSGGGATNINLQLSGAETLPTGNYLAVLLVTNVNLSRVQTVGVRLEAGQSIVLNGGFETGDFNSWVLVGDADSGHHVYNGVAPGLPDVVHAGNFGARLHEGGYLATLTQTAPTTSNQLYQFSFWLDNPVSNSGQYFIARWDGLDVVNLSNPPVFAWTNFQFLVTAPGTNTQLQFLARNDPYYFGFDDVAVTPVPPVIISGANVSGGNLSLAWNSLAGLKYEIQSTTNLAPVNWRNRASLTATTNVSAFVDTNVLNAASQQFYRLVLVP